MTLPKKLLSDVAWSCGRKRFPDLDAFAKDVQQYQDDIMGERSGWRPNETVLEVPSVLVMFEAWDQNGESQHVVKVELTADNNATFSQLELFHKLNDGIGEELIGRDLYLYDHCFFEGLSLSNDGMAYWIWFGS